MNEIKKILFSPIGGSDPINAGYDGSWLHCCRHYQPDLTVIYLSAEMLGYDDHLGMERRHCGGLAFFAFASFARTGYFSDSRLHAV